MRVFCSVEKIEFTNLLKEGRVKGCFEREKYQKTYIRIR